MNILYSKRINIFLSLKLIQRKIDEPKLSKAIKSEMLLINAVILSRLVHSLRSSPIVRSKFQPSKSLMKYLIQKYKLNHKFQNGSAFLMDHFFVTRRFLSSSDYCEVLMEENGQFCFKIKLNKSRKKSIFLNNLMDKSTIFFKPELHFEFVVETEKFE